MSSWVHDGHPADLQQGMTGGAPQRVGWFRFYFADQRWEWSEQVQRMHGYTPGTVTPTTELVLAHKHPDDQGQVAATINEILHTHEAFSTRHRIVDTDGNVHDIVVVGDQLHDNQGGVIGTRGFYVDVSALPDHAREDLVKAKLAEITQNRAGIEQAKGMLMLVYGIDDHAAFNLLKWLSQEGNIKLRLLAEQVCADFRDIAATSLASRSPFDHSLLTAHQRVGRNGHVVRR